MKKQLRTSLAAAFLLLPAAATLVALPSTVLAQPAPEVRSLEASADGRLEPGTSLTFTLEGTPQSDANVRIRGLRENIPLRETQWGQYVGRYTIKRGDRIEPDSEVRATLESGSRVAAANYELGELLPRQRVQQQQPRLADLRIERFGMAPLERIEPGAELRFGLEGTPGAMVFVDLPGITNDLALREVRPGVYEGGYTLRRADNYNPNRPIVATLRMGDRVTTANLNRPASLDSRAPTLTFLVPAEGTTVAAGPSVHIAATFDDAGGSGVDPASVQIVVSGRNVTRDAQISRQSLSFWGALPAGRHTVDVTARDIAGNAMRKSWSFDVAGNVAAPQVVPQVLVRPGGVAPVILGVPVQSGMLVQVLNHYDNGEIGPDPVLVRGRTAPGATVFITVRAVPPLPPAPGVPRTVFAQTLQADQEGNFSFTMVPGTPYPGERYDMSMVTRRGSQTQESRFSLIQRQ